MTLQTGGDIYNCQDWNGDKDLWEPEDYSVGKLVNEGGNIWSIHSGYWAYAFNVGTTVQGGFAGNEFRVYPIRGRHDVYYSIAPQIPVELEFDYIPSRKAIKIWKDDVNVQYAFYIGIDGWKLANFIRPTYNSDIFTQRFNVSLNGGLQLLSLGRYLLYQNEVIGVLPLPTFTEKNTDNMFDIVETLNAGELILSISGLQGLDMSQGGIFDPSLGPISVTQDTHMDQGNSTTGYGAASLMYIERTSGGKRRVLILWDISAIPAGSTITACDEELNVQSANDADRDYMIHRCTRNDWDALDGAGQAANWTNYEQSGPTAWTAAGGDYTATDQYEFNYPGGTGYFSHDIPLLGQEALDNQSGILSLLHRFKTEDTDNSYIGWAAIDHGTTSIRPKLTVTYTTPADVDLNTSLGWIPLRRLLRQL
jgi:hypothetical protein